MSATVRLDPSRSCGHIRPLHGMNAGPMTKVFTYDARPLWREAGFPHARLHDVEYPYGSGEFVDIPCIFKNFDADETLPESYNFGLTDEYIRQIVEVGSEPLFRLGVSIEHAPVKRYIYPPKDYAKWARICEHIIRHYTEGWADGFNYKIDYWEIWNEADGKGNMWIGTAEEFAELYCVAAKHLKSCFPHLKIGGCGWTRAANEFIERFFQYITAKDERIPMDFYSWHRYFTDMDKLASGFEESVQILKKYGYEDSENVFDEWNYMGDWSDQPQYYVKLKQHYGAAYCAAVLCYLQQKTNVAVATYFEADVVKEWCGPFEVTAMRISRARADVGPLKPFYAFKYFNELYKLGPAVDVETDAKSVYACAAFDGKKGYILAANYEGEERDVNFDLGDGLKITGIRLTDIDNTDTPLPAANTVKMKDHSFVLIEFEA